MLLPLALVAGLLPGLAWLLWLRRKDDWEPEPLSLLLRVFALGCGAAFLVAGVRLQVELLLPLEPGLRLELADAFLATALLEEWTKLAAVAAGALLSSEWDEPLDGLMYAAAAALGFASVENGLYLAATADPLLLAARSLSTSLGHVAFTASGGLLLGLARLGRGWRRAAACLGALVLPSLLHGAYDLVLRRPEPFDRLALAAVLPVCVVLLALKLRWARARSPRFHPVRAALGRGKPWNSRGKATPAGLRAVERPPRLG